MKEDAAETNSENQDIIHVFTSKFVQLEEEEIDEPKEEWKEDQKEHKDNEINHAELTDTVKGIDELERI